MREQFASLDFRQQKFFDAFSIKDLDMKTHIYRSIAVALLALFFAQSSFATCGGGGGGGGGGTSNNGGGGGGGNNPPVYNVPWNIKPTAETGALVLYWFLSSNAEYQNSSLRQS